MPVHIATASRHLQTLRTVSNTELFQAFKAKANDHLKDRLPRIWTWITKPSPRTRVLALTPRPRTNITVQWYDH